MWLYMPSVGKPIRITSLQSVTGSIFNNADILRVDYTAEYDVETAEEQPDAYLLSLKAKTGDVAYDRLKMWVDKKQLLPVTIEALCGERPADQDAAFQGHQGFRRRHQAPCDAGNGQSAAQGVQVGHALVGPEEGQLP